MEEASKPLSEPIYVKTTADGRKVEVIDGWVCLAGAREADQLIELLEHPNRQAIRKFAPGTTHMAGRIALSHAEAAIAQGGIDRAKRDFINDPVAINERFRLAIWRKTALEGVE